MLRYLVSNKGRKGGQAADPFQTTQRNAFHFWRARPAARKLYKQSTSWRLTITKSGVGKSWIHPHLRQRMSRSVTDRNVEHGVGNPPQWRNNKRGAGGNRQVSWRDSYSYEGWFKFHKFP
ncbi:hypothetical protein CLAIMM_09791 [Cladophialophora immunda]|nr:hypothetical protein CLAIMM_09791 [Cladophialophora immunda]